MRASVGDRMVVAGAVLGAPVRDGEIVEVRDRDGGPPFLVRWSDTGRESLFFPGPDSHVDHHTSTAETEPAEPASSGSARSVAAHVKTWRVDVYLYEDAADTAAHAVLHTGDATRLDSRAEAHRNPHDEDVPEIGDEIAVARALRRLADRLLGAASDDIAAVEGHPVHVKA
ncbi:MAG TPA: dsRBD fold-containing protein [Microlunatus sp.]|nr:dsRBD fold-containing protein [Microlunatus sp.]